MGWGANNPTHNTVLSLERQREEKVLESLAESQNPGMALVLEGHRGARTAPKQEK